MAEYSYISAAFYPENIFVFIYSLLYDFSVLECIEV